MHGRVGWCVCVWFGAAAHMVSASLAAAAATEGSAFSAAASVVAEDIAAVAVLCVCARGYGSNNKGGG